MQPLLWLRCEVLDILGVWLYIITFFPGFDGSSQLTTIQLRVIHAYSSLPFTPMFQYFGRQSINMCCPDNFEEMDTSLEYWRKTNFFVSEKFIFKKSPSDPNISWETLQRCLSNLTFPQKGHWIMLLPWSIPFFFWFETAKITKVWLSTVGDLEMVQQDSELSDMQFFNMTCYCNIQLHWFS